MPAKWHKCKQWCLGGRCSVELEDVFWPLVTVEHVTACPCWEGLAGSTALITQACIAVNQRHAARMQQVFPKQPQPDSTGWKTLQGINRRTLVRCSWRQT